LGFCASSAHRSPQSPQSPQPPQPPHRLRILPADSIPAVQTPHPTPCSGIRWNICPLPSQAQSVTGS
jgi:hypothetical protein